MKKTDWKGLWSRISGRLQFLRLSDTPDLEDEIQIEEGRVSSPDRGHDFLSGEDMEKKLSDNRRYVFYSRLVLMLMIVGIAAGFVLYNDMHTFEDYIITKSYENDAVSGTKYESVGKYIYRYNSDGISCVTRKNELKWSITYNMQAPIVDVCGDRMVVAEQQGNQVYVVDENGLKGNFETLYPILKVRVSKQGVVAAVLQEDDVTWVNMYQEDGTSIANDKTTMKDSGYPLDVALSPNGQKLAVSYAEVSEGLIRSRVVFYDFGPAGQSKENHIVSEARYEEILIPEIYFTDNSRAVAVADNGFIVFRGNSELEENASKTFEEEIVATFHDGDEIGFLFRSQEDDSTYRMELYNYHGKRKVLKKIDSVFSEVKMENGQILMKTDKGCDIYTSSGQKRYTSAYEKDIEDIFYFSEFRKYLVITRDSFDRIRITG